MLKLQSQITRELKLLLEETERATVLNLGGRGVSFAKFPPRGRTGEAGHLISAKRVSARFRKNRFSPPTPPGLLEK